MKTLEFGKDGNLRIQRTSESRIKEMEAAIARIAPWLSASLDDKSCEEYLSACNAIFELDAGKEPDNN